jgi:hypothetical protein
MLFKVDVNDWKLNAPCGANPTVRQWFLDYETDRESAEAAKRVCSTCPVRRECATYSTDPEISWGIWAGQERAALVQDARQVPMFDMGCLLPGTIRGVFAHDRKNESLCEQCLVYNQKHRGKVQDRKTPGVVAARAKAAIAARSRPEGECRIWEAATSRTGKPRLTVQQTEVQVLRWLLEDLTGEPVPRGVSVVPACGNVLCVEVRHAVVRPRAAGSSDGCSV